MTGQSTGNSPIFNWACLSNLSSQFQVHCGVDPADAHIRTVHCPPRFTSKPWRDSYMSRAIQSPGPAPPLSFQRCFGRAILRELCGCSAPYRRSVADYQLHDRACKHARECGRIYSRRTPCFSAQFINAPLKYYGSLSTLIACGLPSHLLHWMSDKNECLLCSRCAAQSTRTLSPAAPMLDQDWSRLYWSPRRATNSANLKSSNVSISIERCSDISYSAV